MKRYADLLSDALTRVREIQPWDLRDRLAGERPPLVLDIREPAEFAQAHIPGALSVPRGVLEQACEWDFEETVPLLARSRDLAIVVVCRSGNRSHGNRLRIYFGTGSRRPSSRTPASRQTPSSRGCSKNRSGWRSPYWIQVCVRF